MENKTKNPVLIALRNMLVFAVCWFVLYGIPDLIADFVEPGKIKMVLYHFVNITKFVALIAGCAAVMMFSSKEELTLKEVIAPRKKLQTNDLIMFAGAAVGVKIVFTLINRLIVRLSYSGKVGDMFSFLKYGFITSHPGSLYYLLYTCIAAPVFLGLVFRGFTGQYLEKSGVKKFAAIGLPALGFTLFCKDGPMVYVLLLGLLLGWVAYEYGIFWSIAIHFCANIYNFIAHILVDKIPALSITTDIVVAVGCIAAAVILFMGRMKSGTPDSTKAEVVIDNSDK